MVAFASCAALAGLSAESSCADFNQADINERHAAVQEIASDLKPDVQTLELGNAQLNVEYICGQDPDRNLGDAVDSSLI